MADDDIPPLEDMSDLLQQVETLRNNYQSTSNHQSTSRLVDCNYESRYVYNRLSEAGRNREQNVNANAQFGDAAVGYTEPANQNNLASNNQSSTSSGAKPKTKNFAGLKSGFLLNKTAEPLKNDKLLNETKNLTETNISKSKKTYNKDMPFIKMKQGSVEHDLELPEVQEAMKASNVMLQNKDVWLTKELLDKVENDEFMCQCLSDPVYIEAITEMHSDPRAALLRHQHNPNMQRFLRQFMALMGDHFLSLQNETKKTKSHNVTHEQTSNINVSKTNKNSNISDEDRKVQEMLANPEVLELLKDLQVQRLLETMRSDPEQGQRMVHSASPDLQRKIRRLYDFGLVSF